MQILLMPGSRRGQSLSGRLLKATEESLLKAADLLNIPLAVDSVQPDELDAPLYEGDLEAQQGVPAAIKQLNQRMGSADALVMVTPEYNGFFTPLLKNTLDWMSRRADNQPGTSVFTAKPALILAASPGALGGLRALPMLRLQLSNLGLNVFHGQLAVAQADKALTVDGQVSDAKLAGQLEHLAEGFCRYAQSLSALKTDQS